MPASFGIRQAAALKAVGAMLLIRTRNSSAQLRVKPETEIALGEIDVKI